MVHFLPFFQKDIQNLEDAESEINMILEDDLLIPYPLSLDVNYLLTF